MNAPPKASPYITFDIKYVFCIESKLNLFDVLKAMMKLLDNVTYDMYNEGSEGNENHLVDVASVV